MHVNIANIPVRLRGWVFVSHVYIFILIFYFSFFSFLFLFLFLILQVAEPSWFSLFPPPQFKPELQRPPITDFQGALCPHRKQLGEEWVLASTFPALAQLNLSPVWC